MREPDHKYIASLVILAQKNDSDAFAELYAMTYNKVFNYACYYLKDRFLAQDAVQEVYILALKNITKIKDTTLFIAWINQISFHVCYDICKKRNGNYGFIDEAIMETVSDDHIDVNPEQRFVQSEEARRLNEAIKNLPINEQQVITMKFHNNMKLDDIADAMDISKSTVKRYVTSGQETLHKLLKE
ncbi:MAG TPA: sigma-70 family RNA polymerase sigma factor [Lachnospiraceae bacterium]|nr:sigma-70 family RNA polymerase sigma factor [Lachnospiraceae bacterium]